MPGLKRNKQITLSGAGCCLVDQIYPDIDFSDPKVAKSMSRKKGDGGLHPGRLVFSEQFEKYIGIDLDSFMEEISSDRNELVFNVGGPSIVALIHAAQLLLEIPSEVNFHGTRGNDKAGEYLQSKLEQTRVRLKHFVTVAGFHTIHNRSFRSEL